VPGIDPNGDRQTLERRIAGDLRALTVESERIAQAFATANNLSANDFRALLYVLVAEESGTPLTPGQLGRQLGLSAAAITYLVERMISSGHLRREPHPTDRRKVILRYADHGMRVAEAFFTPLAEHTGVALSGLSDTDLVAAHRTLVALAGAMRAFGTELGGSAAGAAPGRPRHRTDSGRLDGR